VIPVENRDTNNLMPLPDIPMAPVTSDQLPKGDDWGYQLKWDGVRLLARITGGQVELFSRKLLQKNSAYPELVEALSCIKGPCLIDGEAFVFDQARQRPVFRKVLERERLRNPSAIARAGSEEPVRLALFDVLYSNGTDWRGRPYAERHNELLRLFPEKRERLFATDLFSDGEALWRWVEERGWEGIVAKRLSSPYRDGKKHKDWLKMKTALLEEVDIVGFTYNEGRLASLIMSWNGLYFGRVSLGLTEDLKRKLGGMQVLEGRRGFSGPFPALPPDLKGIAVAWLEQAFRCTVTGLEVTDAGLLRHSKLVTLPLP
jgi:bifunctional non-homologous end joining protein LigD